MKKILIIFGTRPEAIKMAPLIEAFQTKRDCFETRVCVTAQHREMLDQVLGFFHIIPDYDLDIMQNNQNLYDITSAVLLGLHSVLLDFKPDMVFVHGDTSTTFAASLAAFYQKTDIAHIEAGLRTGDIMSPWPEEANRQLTARLATYHFAPTIESKTNLLDENISEEKIKVVGNTVIDALFITLEKIKSHSEIEHNILIQFKKMSYIFRKERKIILVTGHRRENHGEGLINICDALNEIALCNKNIDIIYPVHLSPHIQTPVRNILKNTENIYLVPPLEYEQFVYLMEKSYIILTDSGGIQEEAPSLKKPVLVMRTVTERPEAVDVGVVKLVGTNKKMIVTETQRLLDDASYYATMIDSENPYGNGRAAVEIVSFVQNILKA